MPFEKGNPGRPTGSQNRLTRTIKETVLEVFNQREEDPVKSLSAFADEYPRDFYAMAAKLIPTEISGSVNATVQVISGMEIK